MNYQPGQRILVNMSGTVLAGTVDGQHGQTLMVYLDRYGNGPHQIHTDDVIKRLDSVAGIDEGWTAAARPLAE